MIHSRSGSESPTPRVGGSVVVVVDPSASVVVVDTSVIVDAVVDAVDDLVDEYGSGGYGKFKDAVADAVIATLAPIRSAYQSLEDEEVARMMRRGALDARTRAEGFQQIVREATGLAAI